MFASHYSYFGNTIKTVNLVLGLDFQHDRKLVERSIISTAYVHDSNAVIQQHKWLKVDAVCE